MALMVEVQEVAVEYNAAMIPVLRDVADQLAVADRPTGHWTVVDLTPIFDGS